VLLREPAASVEQPVAGEPEQVELAEAA
jgi:hypothetical protein